MRKKVPCIETIVSWDNKNEHWKAIVSENIDCFNFGRVDNKGVSCAVEQSTQEDFIGLSIKALAKNGAEQYS